MLNPHNSQNYLAPAAFIGGIVVAAAANQVVNNIYGWWTGLSAFDEATKTRHNTLQESYRKMGADANCLLAIPDFWKLDLASRPTFKMELDTIIAEIRDKINEYQRSSKRTGLFISALLEKVSSFLDSVKKHNWIMDAVTGSGMSKSGVEAMFLGEMISWLTSSFCLLALESNKELEVFKARIEYCREISSTIPTVNTHNDFRPSFKSFLEDLVSSMEGYYRYCQSQQNARELNDYVKEVEDTISVLTKDMIRLVMALNIHSNYKKDNFDLLMSPPMSNYPKINAMRNSGLGNWLYSVMYQIGVLNTAYCTNYVLTVKEIERILANQHPYDNAFFYKNNELADCNNPAWGHRSFVLHLEDSLKKAEQYNLIIREIIRGIAWLFFIQKNLKSLKIISSGNGLIWVYGSPLGKILLRESIKNIEWILEEKIRAPLDLLVKAYINDGIRYCKKHKQDYAENKDYSLLTHLNAKLISDNGILGSGGHLAGLKATLKNIVEIANKNLDMKEKIRQEQAVLISDLLDTFKLRNCNYFESETFITLSQVLEGCQIVDTDIVPVHWNKVITNKQSIKVDYYHFHYSYDKLPNYNEAVRLLAVEDAAIPDIEAINHDLFTSKYGHHASLTNIYMRFIQFYLEDIGTKYMLLFETSSLYAFFMTESWVAANTLKLPREKLPDLRKIWFSINSVFKYLMSLPAVPEIVELELIVYIIKEKLQKFYLKHKEIPAILLGFEMMWQVVRTKDSVDVCLNNFALSLTNSAIQLLIGGYIEKIEKLEQELEDKKRELKETKSQVKALQIELAKKNAIINENNDKIKQIIERIQSTANSASENGAIERLTKINESLLEEISRLNAQIQSNNGVDHTEQNQGSDPSSIGTLTAAATEEVANKKSNKKMWRLPSVQTAVHFFIKTDKYLNKSSTIESKEEDVKDEDKAIRIEPPSR